MIVERKEYLTKLISWKDKQIIKIVTGVRRCGKSMLLKIYQNYLKDQGIEEEQIIAINFEDLDYEELTDYKKLYAYLKERLTERKKTYIFLDEIQNVEDFPNNDYWITVNTSELGTVAKDITVRRLLRCRHCLLLHGFVP